MILPPRRATWRRYRQLANTRYSLYRSLEYEAIQGLVLEGRTLDLGGGRVNSYEQLLEVRGQLDSVNISPKVQPTFIADLNQPLPMEDRVYDNVLSLNTLEHIERDEVMLREMFRVLKPGGTFHIGVPFLYRVHGSPSDYHRHTAYWWASQLQRLPEPPAEVVIEPLVWDPVGSAFSITEFTRLRAVRKKLLMLRALWSHRRMPRDQERLAEPLASITLEFALGYYIHGRK